MKQVIILVALLPVFFCSKAQLSFSASTEPVQNLGQEVAKLKEMIRQLQENELQSDKSRYQKNYQLIVNGIEIIREMHQGTLEISGARSQNIFYKKLLDINNPNSEVLGFQLLEVINKTTEDNINLLPITEKDKRRLRGQVTNVFDGLKRVFPPLQIISSVFSVFSGFNTYQARLEKLTRRADSLIVDVSNPISSGVIQKINQQLQPYITFYAELDRANNMFENALYQHEVEYRDYLEEINSMKLQIEKKINWNETIGNQISDIFDLGNSSRQDFNYRNKLESDTIRDLVSNCITVYEMVDRYKKFTNDFIIIQDDFYKKNLSVLERNARSLPYKDNGKIDQLIEELHELKNGDPSENRLGFDASYKLRLKSIMTKLHAINKFRT